MIKELGEELKEQFECLEKKYTEKYITFSVSIKKHIRMAMIRL